MRILMLLFPEAKSAPGSHPAVTLELAASAYYAFRDAGIEVVLASSEGGPTPMDETRSVGHATEAARLKQDRSALDEFADTLRLDQAYVEDFDAAFCVGRPDALQQPNEAKSAGSMLASFLATGKPVAVTPGRTDGAPNGMCEILAGASEGMALSIARAVIGIIRELRARGGTEQWPI